MEEKVQPGVGRAFQESQELLCLSRAKIALLLGIVIFPAFTMLDHFAAPQFFGLFLCLRLLTAAEGLLTFLFFWRFREVSLKLSSFLMVLYVLTIEGAISYMCFRLGGFASYYYTGLIVVLLGISLIMPWHPFYMLLFDLGTCGCYLSQYFFVGFNAPVGLLATTQFFLICSFVLTFIASVLQYRLQFKIVWQQERIKAQKGELEEINQHLKELSDLKSQLIFMASHDLRGPLSVLRECFVLIGKRFGGQLPPDETKLLAIGKENVGKMLKLINELLDVNRIEAGEIRLEKRRYDLIELIQNEVEAIRLQAEQKGVEISSVNGGRVIWLHMDPGRVSQVLDNLLRNAIRHTPRGGRVTVDIEEKPGEILCSVEDTGEGISGEYLPHLFNRFARFGETEGLGLGLFISKRFIEMHGGRIWVESSLGEGATFWFSLPR